MATVSLENVMLLFRGWLENSTPLSVMSSFGAMSSRSAPVSVASVEDAGILLISPDGKTQFSLALSDPETLFWYSELREFSSQEEYKEMFSSRSEADKFRSTVGIKFSVRATAPGLDEVLIPIGKIVIGELFEE